MSDADPPAAFGAFSIKSNKTQMIAIAHSPPICRICELLRSNKISFIYLFLCLADWTLDCILLDRLSFPFATTTLPLFLLSGGARMLHSTEAQSREIDHEKIASLAISTYLNKLPPRGAKPGTKSNGHLEWTVLAAFILSFPSPASPSGRDYALISLATGLKCLPYTLLPPNGDVLHDQHAEVLARRGARLWLLNRLHSEVNTGEEGGPKLFEKVEDGERRKLSQEVQVHLYVSTLPCGDASNKLLEFQRAAQDQVAGKEGALTLAELLELHTTDSGLCRNAATGATGGEGSVVRGRASSSHLSSSSNSVTGSLRTKPGRPDSPPSIAMSCSDKIALWNAPEIGIQGSLLSALLTPIYINSITISDHPTRHIFPSFPLDPSGSETEEKQRAALRRVLAKDCKRALNRARTQQEGQEMEAGWSHQPFADSRESKLEQAWSAFSSDITNAQQGPKDKTEAFKANHDPSSCPNSVLHIASPTFEGGKTENLASGTKMGAPTKRAKAKEGGLGERLKSAARSVVCKLNYYQSVVTLYSSISGKDLDQAKGEMLYCDAKAGLLGGGTKAHRKRKDELLGSREDAQKVVERFLSRARDATAIRGGQRREEEKNSMVNAGKVDEELEEEEADGQRGLVATFNGWLRTPASFARFDLHGRTTSVQ